MSPQPNLRLRKTLGPMYATGSVLRRWGARWYWTRLTARMTALRGWGRKRRRKSYFGWLKIRNDATVYQLTGARLR